MLCYLVSGMDTEEMGNLEFAGPLESPAFEKSSLLSIPGVNYGFVVGLVARCLLQRCRNCLEGHGFLDYLKTYCVEQSSFFCT